MAAVHLCDAHYITDAAKYVSVLLLSLRAMLQLELPHINVLSKIDLISQYGDLGMVNLRNCDNACSFYDSNIILDFNLDFYTEVQDLSYLENSLSASLPPRFAALNMAMMSLVEDYSIVGFETLAVEVRYLFDILPNIYMSNQDKNSMLHLTRAIDKATGYVFVPPAGSNRPPDTIDQSNAAAAVRPNTYALFSSAIGEMKGPASDIRDVQERWIDARDQWDAYEKKEWRKEGEMARNLAA